MTEEYILQRDVIGGHRERMENLKKYYPYFRLMENDFSQFQGGKYEKLDMGYLLMAILRFFMEENNFKEKDVTYEEYSSFIREIYERDFGLVLAKAEEQSLSSYIFEKITNDGKPFLWTYYNPEEKKKITARTRLIESHMKNETVYYYLTSEAVEFYLETKEIKEESAINVSQILLSKMITSRNFKGGIDVVRRMNHQVARMKKRREEVVELLNANIFEGIFAYEEFMESGTKWFVEEQKMFHKNMELIQEALGKADSESAYGQAVKDIYDLENELKRALMNHSELLNSCTRLQAQADELISRAKFAKLKKSFDFREGINIIMQENNASALENLIKPLLRLNTKKSFSLASVDKMLTLRIEKEEFGEKILTEKIEENYISDDEKEELRIQENYLILGRMLLYYISVHESFDIQEWSRYVAGVLGEAVLRQGDFYSLLIHLAQKNNYNMKRVTKEPDTFLEEYFKMIVEENPQYQELIFEIKFQQEEIHFIKENTIKNFKIVKKGQEENSDGKYVG